VDWGNSISAGVSLYRLSAIINLNITINENNLIQLIGREKRFNSEICNKDKIYIQFCVRGLSSKKWANDCRVLENSGFSPKVIKNIKDWFLYSKDRLIEVWNDTRPSDCTVGKI
jgi:hypothetical protein